MIYNFSENEIEKVQAALININEYLFFKKINYSDGDVGYNFIHYDEKYFIQLAQIDYLNNVDFYTINYKAIGFDDVKIAWFEDIVKYVSQVIALAEKAKID